MASLLRSLVRSCQLAGRHPSVVQGNIRMMSASSGRDLLFRQLFDNRTYTYTYLLADTQSKEAILIDPVLELVSRDLSLVSELGLNLKYALNTHVHADHVTGTGEIKQKLPNCKSVIGEVRAIADIYIKEGDFLKFGHFNLECRATPGHTDGCTTFVLHEKGMAFTGDALLVRGCGRTDFQQGSSNLLYKSVHEKILSLPGHFLLYPGHDYTGQTVTTVAEENAYNSRLTKPPEQFSEIMDSLNLPYPNQIDRALPLNMVCGLQEKLSVEQ